MATQKKILIIGNGFDLHHELPTKYSQFIRVLINIETSNFTKTSTIGFEDLFKGIDRYNEIQEKFNTENIFFEKQLIHKIRSLIETNKWYNSFKNKLEFEHWIDVENEIKETLIVFDKIIKQTNLILKENINSKGVRINSIFDRKNDLKLDISESEYISVFNLISPNSSDLFLNDNNFFLKKSNVLLKFKTDLFYENLFENLQEFINIFNIYLSEILNVFYKNIDSKYASQLEKIKNEFDFFYTFNYTPTLEKLYHIDEKRVNYLHGKFDKHNHNIVLGIEENEELKKDKVFMFTKYYQKLFNDTHYQFLLDLITTSSTNYNFILFGHSLAENDENYVIELFAKVKQFENTVSIFYFNQTDKAQKLKNLLHIVGRKDIEDLMKKKRLVFIKIDENPFKTVFKTLPQSSTSIMDPSVGNY